MRKNENRRNASGASKTRSFWAKARFELPVLIFLVIFAFWFSSSTWIKDQITAWQNPLNPDVAKIADDAGVNENGKFLLQVSYARINNRDDFNKNCSNGDESQSIVLGCFSKNRIYIFNVSDEKIAGVKSVIAAHEMLHAAYSRLSTSERNRVDQMIQNEIPNIQSADIKNSLDVYKKTEPGEEMNELHSLLATEEKNLPKDLEEYYSKFFSDRQKVVSDYEKYSGVFDELKNQQEKISQDLDGLKRQIDDKTSEYQANSKDLSDKISAFNSCADDDGCFASSQDFQAQRNNLMNQQKFLSVFGNQINNMISQYNSGVDKLNALGVEMNKLNSNLDSRSENIAK